MPSLREEGGREGEKEREREGERERESGREKETGITNTSKTERETMKNTRWKESDSNHQRETKKNSMHTNTPAEYQ